MYKYSVCLSLLVPERTAIGVTEFPDYVQRMMREDEHQITMLANEYNLTIKVSHYFLSPVHSSFFCRITKCYLKLPAK